MGCVSSPLLLLPSLYMLLDWTKWKVYLITVRTHVRTVSCCGWAPAQDGNIVFSCFPCLSSFDILVVAHFLFIFLAPIQPTHTLPNISSSRRMMMMMMSPSGINIVSGWLVSYSPICISMSFCSSSPKALSDIILIHVNSVKSTHTTTTN